MQKSLRLPSRMISNCCERNQGDSCFRIADLLCRLVTGAGEVTAPGLGSHKWEPVPGNGSFFPFFSHRFLRFRRCEWVLTPSGGLVGPGASVERGAKSLFSGLNRWFELSETPQTATHW